MTVNITIRNVPDDVRKELARRASDRNQSMQEYLRSELTHIASKPDMAQWIKEVEARKAASESTVSAAAIVDVIRADRR